MRTVRSCSLSLFVLACLPGCVLHSSAREWNERVDPDGEPVYYMSTTKIGFNLAIFVPFIGDLAVAGLVDDLTEHIKEKDGDAVRIVQADSENYWYGWSPFTWIVSPVVATVAAEYRPSAKEQVEQEKLEQEGATESRWYKPWSW